MWDFGGSLMSPLFQSLTENEVGNGCCLFNVEEAGTDAVGSWGAFRVSEGPSWVHTDTLGHFSAWCCCSVSSCLTERQHLVAWLLLGSLPSKDQGPVPVQDALQLLLQTAIPTCCSLLLSGSTAQARDAPSLVHPLTIVTLAFPGR